MNAPKDSPIPITEEQLTALGLIDPIWKAGARALIRRGTFKLLSSDEISVSGSDGE